MKDENRSWLIRTTEDDPCCAPYKDAVITGVYYWDDGIAHYHHNRFGPSISAIGDDLDFVSMRIAILEKLVNHPRGGTIDSDLRISEEVRAMSALILEAYGNL